MFTALRLRAFTLIELLVVVVVIGLLMALLLPSLGAAREQAKKARCLANLKQIATATQLYAIENHGLLVPIHQSMVADQAASFPGGPPPAPRWLWRTAMWFSWGGRSTDQKFLTDGNDGPTLDDDSPFAARTRPLNRYLFPEATLTALRENGQPVPTGTAYDMPIYRCPSDAGFPSSEFVDDAPPANAGRACYDTLGNSYRASLNMLPLADGDQYGGAFSMGPWGHKVSSLNETGRVVLLGEPLFFNVIGVDDFAVYEGDKKLTILLQGWHRTMRYSNLAYADGSARWTRGHGAEPMPTDLVADALGGKHPYASRGATWRLDVYPASGALIAGPPPETWLPDGNLTRWPFRAYVSNLK